MTSNTTLAFEKAHYYPSGVHGLGPDGSRLSSRDICESVLNFRCSPRDWRATCWIAFYLEGINPGHIFSCWGDHCNTYSTLAANPTMKFSEWSSYWPAWSQLCMLFSSYSLLAQPLDPVYCCLIFRLYLSLMSCSNNPRKKQDIIYSADRAGTSRSWIRKYCDSFRFIYKQLRLWFRRDSLFSSCTSTALDAWHKLLVSIKKSLASPIRGADLLQRKWTTHPSVDFRSHLQAMPSASRSGSFAARIWCRHKNTMAS